MAVTAYLAPPRGATHADAADRGDGRLAQHAGEVAKERCRECGTDATPLGGRASPASGVEMPVVTVGTHRF